LFIILFFSDADEGALKMMLANRRTPDAGRLYTNLLEPVPTAEFRASGEAFMVQCGTTKQQKQEKKQTKKNTDR
jgi:hypothetical protein